jgi:hypothetical protein
MKQGDIVKICDGRWSLEIVGNELRHTYGINLTPLEWVIVATGFKSLPTDDGQWDDVPDNDTIVRHNHRIVFTHSRFLTLAKCPICGGSNP